MKLDEIRERGIEQRLSFHRERLRRDLAPSLLGTLIAAAFFLYTLMSPDEWADGAWFRPGGWLFDRFGPSGAVLVVRTGFALAVLALGAYLLRVVHGLSLAGLRAKRAQIAAEYRVFDAPDRP